MSDTAFLVPARNILAADLAPPQALLAPLLTNKTLALLHGPRGLGKTFVALGIAHAVASGGAFLGWQAPAPRRVIYIDGEMPVFDLKARLAMLGEAPKLLDFLMADVTNVPDLGEMAGLSWLLEHVINPGQRHPHGMPALLVLDNLASLVGYTTNDPDRWTALQRLLVRLRRCDMVVLIVHHTNKKGRQRGTSRREDILDLVLSLRRPDDYRTSDGARFEIHVEKARSVFGAALQPLRAWLETDSEGGVGGLARWRHQPLGPDEFDRALACFRAGDTPEEVARQLGFSRSKAYELRRQAGEMGLLGGLPAEAAR